MYSSVVFYKMMFFYEFEQWNMKLKESPVSLTICIVLLQDYTTSSRNCRNMCRNGLVKIKYYRELEKSKSLCYPFLWEIAFSCL